MLYSDLKFLNQKLPLFNSISETIIAVEEHRLMGSLASVLATLLPNKKIYGFTVDEKWPKYGGSHYEVLDYLNFSADRLEVLVKSIKQGG
ncbi:UNVERIFIED_ORG: transketolase C-terminal domain/subunit [Heyndrickxia coagulans]